MYQIEYYEENGEYPVTDFLKSLPPKEKAKILREIDLLEQFGFYLGSPYIKKIVGTEDLWELRIKHSSNIFRIFYFHYCEGMFVLVHAIRKKTQKTPKKEIETALTRIKKYRERKDKEKDET